MKFTAPRIIAIVLACLFLSVGSIAFAEDSKLLIYCGVTMAKPVAELADEFMKSESCPVEIKTGGSGNLLSELASVKRGDLFLPGSDSYVQKAEKKGFVAEQNLVGYNKAAMMVRKGNPKGIPASLDSLADSAYRVAIGNPKSGSIGKETGKILKKKGIYDAVVENAVELATASKTLMTMLKHDQADLVVNWYATSTWPGNVENVDVLPISSEFAAKKKLVMAVLSFSENPELAGKFLKLAASDHGKEVFNKYGLYDME